MNRLGRIRWRPALLSVALTVGAISPSCSSEPGGPRLAEETSDAVASPHVRPAAGSDILRAVKQSDARVVLVNVWATWCVPCREEFPEILRLGETYRDQGLRVIFVSGDFESELRQVVDFLQEQGVDFPTYIKTGKDMAFIDALEPRWSGALPASFVYDREGKLVDWWQGKASYDTFEKKILRVLGENVGG